MRVLFLGYTDSPLIDFIRQWDEVAVSYEKLADYSGHDFLVSYGYRHILRPETLALYPGKAINLHISYLPWNRGSDPNLWSWIENTPKGVTIHHLDSGIDTGDIIAQREIEFSGDETLASSYAILRSEMESLFRFYWPIIRDGKAPRTKQDGAGSYHLARQKSSIGDLLAEGWDTPVSKLSFLRSGS